MESKKINALRRKMQYLSDSLKKSYCESVIIIYNTKYEEVHTLGSKVGEAFCKSCTDIDIMFVEYCKSKKVDNCGKSGLGNVKRSRSKELDTEKSFVIDSNDNKSMETIIDVTESEEDSSCHLNNCSLPKDSNTNYKIDNIHQDIGHCGSELEKQKRKTKQSVNENSIPSEDTLEVLSKSDGLRNTYGENHEFEVIPIDNINVSVDDDNLKEILGLKSAMIEKKIINGKCSYCCKLCSLQLFRSVDIQEHVSKHLRDDPFICKLCGKKFKGRKTLWRHTNSHKLLPYQCDVCLRMFKTVEKLEDHKHSHSLVHACNECEKTYDSVSRLNFHKKLAHGPKQNTCETCGASFTHSALLKQHKIRHGPKLFFCDRCSNSYFFHHELQSHIKTHDEHSSKHKCDVCPRQYVTKSRLNEHMKVHDGKNFVKCEECEKSYSSKKSLNLHKVSAHSREKKYVCQICGKAFSYKHHLSNHLISHDDTRALKCRYCDATFKRNDILKMHENVHTKEKKFVCDVCGQDFLRRSSLRNHRLKHMSGPGRWKCRYCNDKFRTQSSMLTHVKNKHADTDLRHEKPMCRRCEQCSKVFALGRTYKIHLDMHAGIKRHKCNVCDSSFTDPTNLRAHLKTHSGPSKRHKCPLCELSFASARHCTVHMDKHNKSIAMANKPSSSDVSRNDVDSSDDSRKSYQCSSVVDPEFQTMNNVTHSLIPVNTSLKMCTEVFSASIESTNSSLVIPNSSLVNDSVTYVSEGMVRPGLALNDTMSIADSLRQSMNVRRSDEHTYSVLF